MDGIAMSKQFKFIVTCGTPGAPMLPGDFDMFTNEQENHTITVAQIIERFCAQRTNQERFFKPESWSLRWYQGQCNIKDHQGNMIPKRATYVTDANKHIYLRTAPNLVYLSPPPEEFVKAQLKQLESGNQVSVESSLIQMRMSIGDPVFAEEFVKQQGFEILMKTFKENVLPGQSLKFALQLCCELISSTQLVSLRDVSIDFFRSIVRLLYRPETETDAVQTVLNILNECLQSLVNAEVDSYVLSQVTPLVLTHLLERDQSPAHALSILSLLNTIGLRMLKNDPKKFKATHDDLNKRTRKFLFDKGLTKDNDLVHHLVVLQRLLLYPVAERYESKVLQLAVQRLSVPNASASADADAGNDSQLAELESMVEEIRNLSFEPTRIDSNLIKRAPFACLNDSEQRTAQFALLGFTKANTPLLDFSSAQKGGVLALLCLHFMVTNEPHRLRQIVSENSELGRDSSDLQFPLVRVAIEVTHILHHALELPALDEIESTSSRYVPLVFAEENSFELAFCACVGSAYRVFRDMQANRHDLDQVLRVVREQAERSLAEKPETPAVFKTKMLRDYSYSKLQSLWEQEDAQGTTKASAHIMDALRNALEPEIRKLIKEHRCNLMMKGQVFIKSQSSDRLRMFPQNRRDQKFMFCCLSQNQKVLLYKDIHDPLSPPQPEQLIKPDQFFIDSIAEFVQGSSCPHVVEAKETGRKTRPGDELAMTLMSNQGEVLNFFARDKATFDIWIDGIKALRWHLNDMDSESCKRDLEDLLAIEIKVRMMELDHVELPDKPITLPVDDPPSYDFDVGGASDD